MVALVGIITFLILLFPKKTPKVNLMNRYVHLLMFKRYGNKHFKNPTFLNPLTSNIGDELSYYVKEKDEHTLKAGWVKK